MVKLNNHWYVTGIIVILLFGCVNLGSQNQSTNPQEQTPPSMPPPVIPSKVQQPEQEPLPPSQPIEKNSTNISVEKNITNLSAKIDLIIEGLDYSSAHFRGNPSGKIVIVEYSDYGCSYCARAEGTLKQLLEANPDVKLIYRQFELPHYINPQLDNAAEAAECAGKQGKFWEMHGKIFANYKTVESSSFELYATQIGLSMDDFKACMTDGAGTTEVQLQTKEGERITGLTVEPSHGLGAPMFIIYSSTSLTEQQLSKLRNFVDKNKDYYLQVGNAAPKVVYVEGAGTGIVFRGSVSESLFQEALDAFE